MREDFFGNKVYRMCWLIGHQLFEQAPKKPKNAQFAICEFSGRICKITDEKDILPMLIIRDVFVTNDDCEEKFRCLDFDCPLNKTTRETYAQQHNIKLSKIPKDFGKRLAINGDVETGKLHSFKEIFQKKDEEAKNI